MLKCHEEDYDLRKAPINQMVVHSGGKKCPRP
jgi:hypothetical protein